MKRTDGLRTIGFGQAAICVTVAALLVGAAPPRIGRERPDSDEPAPDGPLDVGTPAAAHDDEAGPTEETPGAVEAASVRPGLLTMVWGRPALCLDRPDSSPVRAQCRQAPDGSDRVCVFSGTRETTRGREGPPLERLEPCTRGSQGRATTWQGLIAEGYRFVPGIAEAPPGWHRDAQGRVFQVNFDLHDRIWLGARWIPEYSETGGLGLGRAGIDVGLRAEVFDAEDLERYRFRVLVGEVTLHPFAARGTLFRFDDSRETDTPFLRFTTFWGDPARHDLYLNLGWWVDVLGVDHRPWDSPDETHLRLLAVGGSWDLWHSADLYDYVRLRIGGAFDDLYGHERDGPNDLAVTPLVALDFDLTFDDDGFHHLQFTTGCEAPFVWRRAAGDGPTRAQRFLSELAYEWILIAVNDQPLSLRLSVAGGYRDDVDPSYAGWGVQAGAGLRFSFWAPPRESVVARAGAGN